MIRLDDITPDMDWNKFNRVKEVLNKYGICPLIGVVPDNRDLMLHKESCNEEFWDIIRTLQSEGWAVAQHGTQHIYHTDNTGILGINPFSEFAGLPYEEQLDKLRMGKQILESNGISTDIFMAPGHTYDNNTLKALKECGFSVVTDGLYNRPYYDMGILFIPCRLRFFKRPSGVDTICMHTNVMTDEDVRQLDIFCKTYKDVIVPFNPGLFEGKAGKRNLLVITGERIGLTVRKIKGKMADSSRLSWYLNKTNHTSRIVKMMRRLFWLPLLLFYKKEQ